MNTWNIYRIIRFIEKTWGGFREGTKLLLMFQMMPAVIFVISMISTTLARPEMRFQEFMHGIEWTMFFFFAGIPFEIWLLSIDAAERKQNRKKETRKMKG